MTHFDKMLLRHDAEAARLLNMQERDRRSPLYGAFVDEHGLADTRTSGFALAHLMKAYLIPQSRFYHDPGVRAAMEAAFEYIFSHLRPGGCMDYISCNFASAPDTASIARIRTAAGSPSGSVTKFRQ